MFNLFGLCRKDEISFDIVAKNGKIVAETGNIVAKNGNDVEATFDIVERMKLYDKSSTLLPFVATKSNVASTKSNVTSAMLPVASTLTCWCGRGLRHIGSADEVSQDTSDQSASVFTEYPVAEVSCCRSIRTPHIR